MDYKHGDIFTFKDTSHCPKSTTYFLVNLDVPFESWVLVSEHNTFWCSPQSTINEAFGGWMDHFTKVEECSKG